MKSIAKGFPWIMRRSNYHVRKRQHSPLRRAKIIMLAITLAATAPLTLFRHTAYADTAPTLSSYQASNWSDIANSETTTGALTWSAGDLVIVMGVTENGSQQLLTPVGTGLSFTLITSIGVGDGTQGAAYVWRATPGSGGSSVITAASDDSSIEDFGIAAYTYTGSGGLGNSATITASAATTISLSRTYSNSAVITAFSDWNAVNDTSVTANPSSGGAVRKADFVSGRATTYLADWTDQGAAGSTSYGIGSYTGTPKMTGIAVEVRGLAPSLEQEGYRWRADNGTETSASWLTAQDTNITRTADTTTRLRTIVNDTGDSPSAQYQLEWRKVGGATDWRKISNTPLTGQVTSQVSIGSDDATQNVTAVSITGTTLGGSLDATTDWAAMRFQNMNIPKGATVTSAFLSVVPSGTGEDEPLVTIFGENADNAATYTTAASNISSRTQTAGVAWSSTDLGATGATYHNSPDLSATVQTIINRAGWLTGNPISMIIQGGATATRDLTIEAFENTGNNPPRLTVNYTYPNPAIELAASSNITASGENTTAQLTPPTGKTTGVFTTGRMQDDENPADAVDIGANGYTELEWSIKAIGSVVATSDVYEFRVTKNGTVLDTYSVTPQMTIGTSNTAPSSPTSPTQKKTDDTTLATGDWTNETSIKLTAAVTDVDVGDTIKICAEIKAIGTALTSPAGDGDGCSASGVSSGGTATVTIGGLSSGTEYHWQIKAKDAAGAYSSWVGYGGNTENPPTNPAARDFGVDTSAPTGGTVYDGTSVGTDSDFNDGSLSSLSANWSGFNVTVSGLNKYQYSIGTTAGGTDIKGWTDNGTTASVTVTGLTLQTSKRYFTNVRAVDNAGNTQSPVVSSDGQIVLPSLSFSVSPTTLTFANLNASNPTPYTDTKTSTVTTSTNAYGGYAVRLAATDYLRYGAFTIPDFNGGTYAAPDSWGGGDTGFGYTSSDTSIQGVNIFQSTTCPGGSTLTSPGCYAPYSQTKPGDIVADHTANVTGSPITNQQFTLTHRITTSPTQAAGTYTAVLLYTVTAIY